MTVVSMKDLLESGVHFGHQKRRWDPKMKPYIFTERNDIYIIDLQQTLQLIEKAYDFVKEISSQGQKILFVGTKRQAQEAIKEEAEKAQMPYVNYRWLGGTLTNFSTIQSRNKRLQELEDMEENGQFEHLKKKEVLSLRKEKAKLERNLSGLKGLNKLPNAVFIVDPQNEKIATAEARRLEIPIVAIVDTNCDPDEVDYVIPGNDDAIRAISLITKAIGQAVIEGKSQYEKLLAKTKEQEAEKKAAAEKEKADKAEKLEAKVKEDEKADTALAKKKESKS